MNPVRKNDPESITIRWNAFVWGLGIIVTVVASWFQINTRLDRLDLSVSGIYTKAEIDVMKRDAELVHKDHERRIERLENRR